ncbi:MAG: hypothetical protein Kow001_03790 [Acidobacteriota bacterium]
MTAWNLAVTLLLVMLPGCGGGGTPAGPGIEGTTVILVRHAEKVDDSRDAELSAAGEERAELLARMLMHADVRGLLASEFQRTQQTLRPLAEALGLPIRIVPADQPHEALAVAVRGNRGHTTVIASHVDRIPVLLRELAGVEIEPIAEDEYNRLYIVTMLGEGKARVLELRYGAGEVRPPERKEPLAPFPDAPATGAPAGQD